MCTLKCHNKNTYVHYTLKKEGGIILFKLYMTIVQKFMILTVEMWLLWYVQDKKYLGFTIKDP